MDQSASIVLDMLTGGITLDKLWILLQGLFVVITGIAMLEIIRLFVSGIGISRNKRLNHGETWLRMQRLGGQPTRCKYLKRGLFKVWLFNYENGDLVEMTTTRFLKCDKSFMASEPDNIDPGKVKSASDYGLN